MKFEVRFNVETEHDFDETTLEMYVASQLMGGTVNLEVIEANVTEANEFEQTRVYIPIFGKGDLVVDADRNLYTVREVTPEGIYVDTWEEGRDMDAGCFALDELSLDMSVED